jgi:hypothetical protein
MREQWRSSTSSNVSSTSRSGFARLTPHGGMRQQVAIRAAVSGSQGADSLLVIPTTVD